MPSNNSPFGILGGFNDVDNPSWLWGVDNENSDLGLISWWGQVDFFSYSYAAAGDTKVMDVDLYESMSVDDVRRNQFNDELGPTYLQPFNKQYDESRVTFGTNILTFSDYHYMRYAEFVLLKAEALANMNQDGPARTALNELVSERIGDASYLNSLNGDALKEEIYKQTRLELWGEGKSYFAMKRNMATTQRGTNHLSFVGEPIAHNDDRLTFDYNANYTGYTTPQLAALHCDEVSFSGEVPMEYEAVGDFQIRLPYTTNIGGDYNAVTRTSQNVLGLTASLDAGTYGEFEGELVFNVSGTPLSVGIATFNISIGGRSCSISVNVENYDCSTYYTILSIDFDANPEETYWELYSTTNSTTPLFSGGANGAYTDMTSIIIPFCLDEGDYVLSFFDTNNNGMIGGNYALSDADGNLYACGGTFGDQEISPFSTGVFADLAEVVFELTLDTWPEETTWAIFDISVTPAVELFSGGPYNNPDDDFAVLTHNLCLEPGSYGVLVNDAYGDGIADGGFTVTVGGTVVIDSPVPGTGSSATFTVD